MTTYDDGLDLEALKARLREQAARRAEELVLEAPLPTAESVAGWTFNWLDVRCRLRDLRAIRLDDLPAVEQMGRLKRAVVRAVARVVQALLRPILNRQNHFNTAFLDLLEEAGRSLHSMETRVVQHQEHIRLVEAQLAELQLRLSRADRAAGHPEAGRKAS